MASGTTQTIEIQGVVIPTQWDRRGNIIQAAIQTDSFEKYLVDGEYSDELIQRVDQKVRINGTIHGEDLVGHKIIVINSIKDWLSTKTEGV